MNREESIKKAKELFEEARIEAVREWSLRTGRPIPAGCMFVYFSIVVIPSMLLSPKRSRRRPAIWYSPDLVFVRLSTAKRHFLKCSHHSYFVFHKRDMQKHNICKKANSTTQRLLLKQRVSLSFCSGRHCLPCNAL